jgi:hypothetical protein
MQRDCPKCPRGQGMMIVKPQIFPRKFRYHFQQVLQ